MGMNPLTNHDSSEVTIICQHFYGVTVSTHIMTLDSLAEASAGSASLRVGGHGAWDWGKLSLCLSDMGVSINGGSPKWMVYKGKSY